MPRVEGNADPTQAALPSNYTTGVLGNIVRWRLEGSDRFPVHRAAARCH